MSEHNNDAGHRSYWIEQMEQAHAFMKAMQSYPFEECGERMISLEEVVSTKSVEVVFSAKPHVNSLPRLFYLRAGLIESFLAAAREMNERGWILKVEDGYRTVEMQRHLARQPYVFEVILKKLVWECKGEAPPPELMLRRMGVLVANEPKVGTHMSGSAMDISVLDRSTREEINRGAPYIELSELTPMSTPFISPQAQENRKAITALMQCHGFIAYPWEFWHYSAGDVYAEYLTQSGRAGRYGPVHINLEDGRVTTIEHPNQLLNSLEEVQELIKQILPTIQ